MAAAHDCAYVRRSHEIPALVARTKRAEPQGLPIQRQQQGPDSLPSLLHCLASIYKLHPELWLDETIK